jgi:hypothetical protein
MPQYSDNKIISLNSQDGTLKNGTMLSNIVFNTGCILEEDSSIVDTHISVVNCQLPVSYYTINLSNNTFIAGNYLGSFSLVTIAVGNYNQYTLQDALTYALGAIGTFTFVFDKNTGKMTWNCVTSFTLDFRAHKASAAVLGFDTLYLMTGTTLTSAYPLNLLGVKRISIKSYSLGITNFSSVGGDITLTTIPSDQPPFCMISYVNQNPDDRQLVNVKTINQVDILLLDENDNFLDFNNVGWTLTLMLIITRFKADPTSTFKEIVSMETPNEGKNEGSFKDIEDELSFLTK